MERICSPSVYLHEIKVMTTPIINGCDVSVHLHIIIFNSAMSCESYWQGVLLSCSSVNSHFNLANNLAILSSTALNSLAIIRYSF